MGVNRSQGAAVRGAARPRWAVAGLAVLALASVLAFMTVNVQTDWAFILEHRGSRLLAMLLTAAAIGLSTVLFQTITQNRVLTPALMGFDVLYVLVHALALFAWGAADWRGLPVTVRFGVEVACMTVLALLFFRLLFSGAARSLHLIILLGILFGVLFRELAELAMRVLDPTEFSIQQGPRTASFSRGDVSLVGVGGLIVAAVAAYVVWLRHRLDVLGLGREVAINLGVAHGRLVTQLMVAIALLVSVATALVGPTLFFGLLIANLAYWLTGSHQHRWTLPASMLAGVVCLVGGQVVLEQLLGLRLPLAMMIELAGGLLFIALLLRGVRT